MLRSAVLVGCHDVAFRTGLLCRVVLGWFATVFEGVGRIVNLSFRAASWQVSTARFRCVLSSTYIDCSAVHLY